MPRVFYKHILGKKKGRAETLPIFYLWLADETVSLELGGRAFEFVEFAVENESGDARKCCNLGLDLVLARLDIDALLGEDAPPTAEVGNILGVVDSLNIVGSQFASEAEVQREELTALAVHDRKDKFGPLVSEGGVLVACDTVLDALDAEVGKRMVAELIDGSRPKVFEVLDAANETEAVVSLILNLLFHNCR